MNYLRQEAANILGVCKKTLINWEKQGLIKPRCLKNGFRVFSDEELEYIKENIITRRRKK